MNKACGRQVPEEFVDPQNAQSYHKVLSVFNKGMALKTFEHKCIAVLRAPTRDQDGIDMLTSYRSNGL